MINGIQMEKILKKIKLNFEKNGEVSREEDKFVVRFPEHEIIFYVTFDYDEFVVDVRFDEDNIEIGVDKCLEIIFSTLLEEKADCFFRCNHDGYPIDELTQLCPTGENAKNMIALLHEMPLTKRGFFNTLILRHNFPWDSHDYYVKMILNRIPSVQLVVSRANESQKEINKRSYEYVVADFTTPDEFHAWWEEKEQEANIVHELMNRIEQYCQPLFETVAQEKNENRVVCTVQSKKETIGIYPTNASAGLYYRIEAFGRKTLVDTEEAAYRWILNMTDRYVAIQTKLQTMVETWLRKDPSAFIKGGSGSLYYCLYSFGVPRTISVTVTPDEYILGFSESEIKNAIGFGLKKETFKNPDDVFKSLQEQMDKIMAEHRMGLLYDENFLGYLVKLQHLAGFKEFGMINLETTLERKEINRELEAVFGNWDTVITKDIPFQIGSLTGCLREDKLVIEQIA
jgi:hypothetical protein